MPQGPLAFYNARQKSGSAFIAAPLLIDAQSALQIAALHGAYYEPAYNKNAFFACNSAGVTTTVGLATTYVGLCLANPKANTKNLSIQKVSMAMTVAPAAEALVAIALGFNSGTDVTHTTPLVVQPAGAPGVAGTSVAAATAKADSSSTLPTAPVYSRIIGQLATAVGSFVEPVDGGIILPPGGYLIVATSTAGGASGFFGSVFWEEVAV
jgi:hypothetical protein